MWICAACFRTYPALRRSAHRKACLPVPPAILPPNHRALTRRGNLIVPKAFQFYPAKYAFYEFGEVEMTIEVWPCNPDTIMLLNLLTQSVFGGQAADQKRHNR